MIKTTIIIEIIAIMTIITEKNVCLCMCMCVF